MIVVHGSVFLRTDQSNQRLSYPGGLRLGKILAIVVGRIFAIVRLLSTSKPFRSFHFTPREFPVEFDITGPS